MGLRDGASPLLTALSHEHLGQGLFTHSTDKETEAQKGCRIEVKVRVQLGASSFSSSTLPLLETLRVHPGF